MCVVVDQHGPAPPIRSNAAHLRDHLQDPFLCCGPHIPGSHWKIMGLRQRCFPVPCAECMELFAFLMVSPSLPPTEPITVMFVSACITCYWSSVINPNGFVTGALISTNPHAHGQVGQCGQMPDVIYVMHLHTFICASFGS